MVLVTPYEGDKTKETYAIVEKAAAYMRELAEKTPYITIAEFGIKLLRNTQKFGLGQTNAILEVTISKIEAGAKLYADTIATALQSSVKISQSNQNNLY